MRSRWTISIMTVGAALLVFGVSDAWAWGPATHTHLAADVLKQLALLPAGIAAILARHAGSYIFGSIAADVVFAKRMSRIKQFCHHWSTGFRFVEHAETDADRAFAWGYLSHLAADTVAHNKYVPRQLTVTRSTLNFGHVYWEMRADAMLPNVTWKTMEDTLAADHEHHHQLLATELTATLLPYHFNRRLFDRINRTVARRYWQTCMNVWHRCSRWDLCHLMLAQYHQESIERIMSLLKQGQQSPVLREDPNGAAALHEARLRRREYRQLKFRGLPTARRAYEAAAGLAPIVSDQPPRRPPPELPG